MDSTQHFDIYGSLWLFGLNSDVRPLGILWSFRLSSPTGLENLAPFVLGLQYLARQLMSASIVGSFNGKNWINQQVTFLVRTHRCYVSIRVPRVPIPLLLAAIVLSPSKSNNIAASSYLHENPEA